MKEIKQTLCHFKAAYPAAEALDYIKLIYQNEFGCGHLCPDEAEALSFLTEEWDHVIHSPQIPLFEGIGNGLCRLNLGALQKDDLPLAARVFQLSAQKPRGDESSFRKKLSLLTHMALDGELPLDGAKTASTVEAYLLGGIRPIHHSESYRERYAPHYRVVDTPYAVFFPALRAAEKLLETSEGAILSIEGRCASGKTSLAGMIENLFPCNVFHMDDFFLPFHMRTEDRLSTPGGNVHYERFYSEVLTPLFSGEPFSYRPFCCKDGSFGPPVSVTPRPLSVVEGAYSMHPALRAHYRDSVFLTVSPEIQQSRILVRNGAEMLRMFNERWIPLEERYFREGGIEALCGAKIDTSPLDSN